ncbi:MAG: hypothetical protein K2N25_07080, partial [Muribaculaceae bacterium]|nr:hypothetical protein [Muribaculaceae bacterium]
AVAYNKNGSSRGIPVTVVPTNISSISNEINFNFTEKAIHVNTDISEALFYYQIQPMSENGSIMSGKTEEEIDITDLPLGDYVLSVIEENTNTSGTLKFRK